MKRQNVCYLIYMEKAKLNEFPSQPIDFLKYYKCFQNNSPKPNKRKGESIIDENYYKINYLYDEYRKNIMSMNCLKQMPTLWYVQLEHMLPHL